jgi:polyisoprenoid-binding protein YceI
MTATATIPKTTTWQLDPSHSSVEFSVKHLMIASVKGSFGKFEASLTGDDNDLSGAKITVTIDTSSIDTGNDQRDAHLRSGDFFDVEKYPAITFTGKRIVGDAFGEFKLVGDLTIRDVTREITLDATFEGRAKDPWGNSRLGYTATGKIRRTDFGLNWNQALEAGGVLVSEDVKIAVEAQFVKQQ